MQFSSQFKQVVCSPKFESEFDINLEPNLNLNFKWTLFLTDVNMNSWNQLTTLYLSVKISGFWSFTVF